MQLRGPVREGRRGGGKKSGKGETSTITKGVVACRRAMLRSALIGYNVSNSIGVVAGSRPYTSEMICFGYIYIYLNIKIYIYIYIYIYTYIHMWV